MTDIYFMKTPGLTGRLLCLAVFFLFANGLLAQRNITGVVNDDAGEPVTGAVIAVVEVSGLGTVSDANGKFSLNLPEKGKTIRVSMMGYAPQTIMVGNRNHLNVILPVSSEELDEVVVIGYGAVKKRDLTGSVGNLKREDLLSSNPTSINAGMQGKIAGVKVDQNDGAPGSGVTIQIRGANSFLTSTEPLYVVDGIPFGTASTPTGQTLYKSNPLSSINPNDIESIEVLKDASATAIYGSRGANGVVLITTRKGSAGKDKIEFSATFGMSTVNKLKVLDPYSYANYINEEAINGAEYSGRPYYRLPYSGTWSYSYTPNNQIIPGSGVYSPSPDDFKNPGQIVTDQYGNQTEIGGADWQDQIFTTGITSEYNLSVSGANDKGGYAISGNVLDQEGVIKNSGYTRYTIRTNNYRKVREWVEIGLNASITNAKTKLAQTSAGTGIIRSALLFPTTLAVNVGNRDDLIWLAANPNTYLEESKDNVDALDAFTSSYAELKFTDYLKFRQNIGFGYSTNRRGFYYNRHTAEGRSPNNGLGGQSDNWYSGFTSESLLTFDKKITDSQSLNAVLGITYENSGYGGKYVYAKNFPTDITEEYNLGFATEYGRPSSYRGGSKLLSFLGRVNYSLFDKYLFTVSFRRDGSSKFADGNKFADFASGAFAWRFSEENFLKNQRILSNGKLRISYGETGNQGLGSYATIQKLTPSNYPMGGGLVSGLAESELYNVALKWETTSQVDAGIDLGFLKDRISLTVDMYYKDTRDLLQMLKIPQSTGFRTVISNSGNVVNKGLEITGNFRILTGKPFDWTLNANLSFNQNEISGLEYDQFAEGLWYGAGEVFIQRDGYPIGVIYGYVEDGFWDNEAEIRANPKYASESNAVVKNMIGEIKYRDLNGDGNIGPEDRTIIGDTNPDYMFGITNTFSWKNFTLGVFVQGVVGNDIFNGNLVDVTMSNIANIPQFAYDSRWTKDDFEGARWPKPSGAYDRSWLISDRYVEDGSYVRLKNLNLGYKFIRPVKGIDVLNVYFNATNLITWTDYSWYNPDVNVFGGDPARRGVDYYSYPTSKTFSLGVNVTF